MSLLIDENLSYRVKTSLVSTFDNSLHVKDVSLRNANDQEIWNYAKDKNLTIVSKDSDFHHKSILFGAPPKVIWITIGNCSTDDIIELLLKNQNTINNFIDDSQSSFLKL